MISMRGIALSLAIHGAAAALISASAAIQPEALVEDVAAIPIELVLEMESAPVTPSAPEEEVAETPAVETPVQEVVEAPVVEAPEPIVKPFETASLQPFDILPKPAPEPELVTPREMPTQVPPVVEEKPKPAELPDPKKVTPEKTQKGEKPKKEKLKKPAKKTLNASKKKQVAALAAGKGSVGKQRSTDGRAAESSYNSKVLARLRAAKKYPAAARAKGIEGTAVLSFTISSSGRLTSARVVRGAGHPLLDSAVLSMARNAAPFPPFPSSISKSQKTFSVPVQFKTN